MLPNYFLPEVDELPFSWMNRLALANGFKDTNDMLQSLGFIKGKAVKRVRNKIKRKQNRRR